MNVADVVKDYVAVWNEPDAQERHRRIRALWAPDGATCYRLLDARGYDAIEARVIGAWDKWVRKGKYAFRPQRSAVCHHDAVKFDWEMVTVPGGEVEATGLSFMLLNADGRIRSDYQFNPAVNEAGEYVDRYLAAWNEVDADTRGRRIAELWAPDCAFISEHSVRNGRSAVAAEIEAARAANLRFLPANCSQAHHDVVSFAWQIRNKDKLAAAGADLLILDERGLVRCAYRYHEPDV